MRTFRGLPKRASSLRMMTIATEPHKGRMRNRYRLHRAHLLPAKHHPPLLRERAPSTLLYAMVPCHTRQWQISSRPGPSFSRLVLATVSWELPLRLDCDATSAKLGIAERPWKSGRRRKKRDLSRKKR